MKKSVLYQLLVVSILTCFGTIAVAQTIKKLPSGAADKMLSGTITGTITIPKSAGLPGDFINHLKGVAAGDNDGMRDGFHAYSYKLENNQLADKKEAPLTSIQVIDATAANAPNYTFKYTVVGRFLGGRSIDLVIIGWYTQGATAIVFEKINANQLATFTSEDTVFEGFAFKAGNKVIPK